VFWLTEWYLAALAKCKPERKNGKNIIKMFPDYRCAA
jgi:hypothetical protein